MALEEFGLALARYGSYHGFGFGMALEFQRVWLWQVWFLIVVVGFSHFFGKAFVVLATLYLVFMDWYRYRHGMAWHEKTAHVNQHR